MNQKISRNEKYKYSNEEKLVLGEDENTSALINIVQEDSSNISDENVVDFVYLLLLFLFYFYCIHKVS